MTNLLHTQSSRLFRAQLALFPTHQSHVLGRIICLKYLNRYKTCSLHVDRINLALSNLDGLN